MIIRALLQKMEFRWLRQKKINHSWFYSWRMRLLIRIYLLFVYIIQTCRIRCDESIRYFFLAHHTLDLKGSSWLYYRHLFPGVHAHDALLLVVFVSYLTSLDIQNLSHFTILVRMSLIVEICIFFSIWFLWKHNVEDTTLLVCHCALSIMHLLLMVAMAWWISSFVLILF